MDRTFEPAGRLRGTLQVPPDKSVAHRALLFAAMAAGTSRLAGRPAGADVAATRRCMQELGARFADTAGGVEVRGCRWRTPDRAELDCGNSGTTMRLLCGALAGRPGEFRLSGDPSLSRRPMGRVAAPVRLMGADVATSDGGTPPLVVRGTSALRGIDYLLPVPSAQVKSAVLLAGLQASGPTRVREPAPTRDHTERLLGWLGCDVTVERGIVQVAPGDELFAHPGFELALPGDLSSAAFWLVGAVLCPGSRVRVEGVGLNPGRTGVLEILEAMGAEVSAEVEAADPEPVGAVVAAAGPLRAVEVAGPVVPRTVDELPLVALAATQAEGTTVIRDASELRVKETDRIAVLAAGLRRLGARVEAQPDGLVVDGPTPLVGGVVEAAGDHRMAMAFAVAGLIARGPVVVRGWEAARVSYPGFADDLAGLVA